MGLQVGVEAMIRDLDILEQCGNGIAMTGCGFAVAFSVFDGRCDFDLEEMNDSE